MGALKVGIREFREKLADYLLESSTPIAITRHGETVGYFVPTRRKRTEADREALRLAAELMEAELARAGITEEEVMEDFKAWHKARKK